MLKEDINKAIFNHDFLNRDELNELVRKYKFSRNPEKKFAYREEIFLNVAKLIKKTIGASSSISKEEFDDVFNTTVLSFYEALEHYKPNKKAGFVTYFYFWIKKSILNHCYSRNIIHIQHGAFCKSSTTKESAQRVSNGALVKLDKVMLNKDSDGSTTLHDIIASKEDAEKLLFQGFENESLTKIAKENLSPREFVIIKYRYLTDENWVLSDFCPILKTQAERIRQIEHRAIWKLRKILSNQPVFKFGKQSLSDFNIASDKEFEAHNQIVLKNRDSERFRLQDLSRKKAENQINLF